MPPERAQSPRRWLDDADLPRPHTRAHTGGAWSCSTSRTCQFHCRGGIAATPRKERRGNARTRQRTRRVAVSSLCSRGLLRPCAKALAAVVEIPAVPAVHTRDRHFMDSRGWVGWGGVGWGTFMLMLTLMLMLCRSTSCHPLQKHKLLPPWPSLGVDSRVITRPQSTKAEPPALGTGSVSYVNVCMCACVHVCMCACACGGKRALRPVRSRGCHTATEMGRGCSPSF